MGRKILYIFALVALIALVSSYYIGSFSKIIENVIKSSYGILVGKTELDSRTKDEVRVTIGADGGSDLGDYGVKLFFLDGLYFDRSFSWGITRKYHWLVFRYFYNDVGSWLIVPVRGTITVVGSTDGKLEVVEADLVDKKINVGDRATVAVFYRFNDESSVLTIREELVRRRVRVQNKQEAQVEWELGDFPRDSINDKNVKNMFNSGGVIVLGDEDFLLSSIRSNIP